MTAQRKPMTFHVDAPPRVSPLPVKAEQADRQQVGARVTRATYRQLKARAALSGATVQELVEQAITEFLAKPTA
jgi:hypothetical protein